MRPQLKNQPIGYTDVPGIQASLKELIEAGNEIAKNIKDIENGRLLAQLKDNDGNVVGLRQQP